MSKNFLLFGLIIFLLVIIIWLAKPEMLNPFSDNFSSDNNSAVAVNNSWKPPDIKLLPFTEETELIKFGRDLIINTANYLGPKGTIAKMSNGMNCQNCHIEAGTKLYGNCFALVASTYPKYRDRSGMVESIAFRINECMERSLNGKKLDSNSKEMQAMIAYLKWVGKDVSATTAQAGIVTLSLPLMDRAADPGKGKQVFIAKCKSCHGEDGAGKSTPDSGGYFYPPLWGKQSYNVSAGMYRLTRLAPFIKYNMPYSGVKREQQLTDEEAWDVAAFISSQERPEKFFSYDWPQINTKPVDYPFGPFADSFSAAQHKYGPFTQMPKVMKPGK